MFDLYAVIKKGFFCQQETKKICGGIYNRKPKLEDEIDRLVYELYGLSEEEIGIVQGVGN